MTQNTLATTLFIIGAGILGGAVIGGVTGFVGATMYGPTRFNSNQRYNDLLSLTVTGASHGALWPVTLPCWLVAVLTTV